MHARRYFTVKPQTFVNNTHVGVTLSKHICVPRWNNMAYTCISFVVTCVAGNATTWIPRQRDGVRRWRGGGVFGYFKWWSIHIQLLVFYGVLGSFWWGQVNLLCALFHPTRPFTFPIFVQKNYWSKSLGPIIYFSRNFSLREQWPLYKVYWNIYGEQLVSLPISN